MSWFIGVG